ncbi:hypothetical protein ACU686_03100 [Yinghuangia aomiensis]
MAALPADEAVARVVRDVADTVRETNRRMAEAEAAAGRSRLLRASGGGGAGRRKPRSPKPRPKRKPKPRRRLPSRRVPPARRAS